MLSVEEVLTKYETGDIDLENTIASIIPLASKGYVVSRYTNSQPYEVICVTVVKKSYSMIKNSKTFTVYGKWNNGNYYHGTFNLNSINKKYFTDMKSAISRADYLNSKR